VPDDAMAAIARQAPYAAALLILSVGYCWTLWKFLESANKRMDQTEVRHSEDRQTQEERWLNRVQDISGECHEAQDRASLAIEKMATSSADMAKSMTALDSKLDTVIAIARQVG